VTRDARQVVISSPSIPSTISPYVPSSCARRRARMNAVPNTSTPITVAMPPTANPHRGPNWSLIHPTNGPPIGVVPRSVMV